VVGWRRVKLAKSIDLRNKLEDDQQGLQYFRTHGYGVIDLRGLTAENYQKNMRVKIRGDVAENPTK
jgi:hypothetical protein